MRLKALLALLISLLITAAAAYFSYTGLFGLLEREVYNPGVRTDLESNLSAIVKETLAWHGSNKSEAAAFFSTDAARKSVLPQQDSRDIYERARLFGQIQERNPYVLGVRIIAADGKRIHFSTFTGDVLRAENERVVYRNYGAEGDVAPGKLSGVMEDSGILVLQDADAFAYVLPFTDTFNIQGGFAVLYVRVAGLQAELAKLKLFPLGETIKATERGLVFGFPAALDSGAVLQKAVDEAWSGSAAGDFITLGKTQDSDTYVLLSQRGGSLYYGRMVPSSWFIFPASLKLLLVGVFFCIVYIVFFLVFAVRRDPVQVVGERIKRLELELIREYLTEGLPLRERIQEEFERRRPEVKERIRQGLGRRSKKQSELVDAIIDKGWDEIIRVFVRLGGEGQAVSVDMSGIETMLKELLDRWSRQVPASMASGSVRVAEPIGSTVAQPVTAERVATQGNAPGSDEVEDLEELHDLEELGEAEAVSEVAELETAEAEPADIEVLESITEAEPADIEVVESITEAEPVAAVDELEAVDAEAVVETEEYSAEPEPVIEHGTAQTLGTLQPAEAESASPKSEKFEEIEELEELESLDEEEPSVVLGITEDVTASFGVNVTTEALEGHAAGGSEVAARGIPVDSMSADEIQQELLELAGDSSYVVFVNDDDEIPTIPENLGLEILDELNKEYIEKFTSTATEPDYEELEAVEPLEATARVGAQGVEVEQVDDGLIIEEPVVEENLAPETENPVVFESMEPGDFGATGSLEFEQLEITSPFDEFSADAGNVLGDKDFRKRMNRQSLDKEKVRHEIDELLGEVEFDLFLDSFDFSALKNYNDEEGFLEVNEAEIRSILEDSGIEIVEPDNLDAAPEIPMLSDKDRELIEELQLVDIPDSGEPVNAEPVEYMEQYIRHCLPGCSITDVVEGELLTVEEPEGGDSSLAGNVDTGFAGEGVIIEHDGIFTLNRKALGSGTKLDASLKHLADDVLGKTTGASGKQ